MNVELLPSPGWAWTWMVTFRDPMDPFKNLTADGLHA